MKDQQPRDGKKQPGYKPQASETDHAAHAGQSRPDSAGEAKEAMRPKERSKDDPSEAPESGTRDRPDNP